ncbi:MAG: metallophosphoesterase N-terminal domain-containing protein, partial [Planctomycetota bacterium]|nr:metallophosphoesterase N-terminal domain-containing protein [Planctomycetota bacterium]
LLLSTASLNAALTVDFESVDSQEINDDGGKTLARLEGKTSLADDAHGGKAALRFHGAAEPGCVKFADGFTLGKEGTLDFWCKPEKTSGILVGKYGAVNISFKPGGVVYFGLKLKRDGWVECESPKDSVKPRKWLHIQASWGRAGMVLRLNGKTLAGADLPKRWDWFIADRPLLLGTYDWPAGYDVWYYTGVLDDFSYKPEQKDAKFKSTTQKVHKLRLKKTPKPDYERKVAGSVGGRVVLQGGAGDASGVAGVLVTDGYTVTKTDADGRYSLKPSPSAVFIYITRPPQRDIVGSWYKPLAQSVDFALKPAGQSEDEYTFVHVSDTHISSDGRCLRGLSQFVDEVNALEPRLRFVFNTGDLVNLDKQLKAPPARGHEYFRNYTGIMNHLAMPHYHVAGDHTDSSYRLDDFPLGDHRAGKAMYWEYLGPNIFSFEYGKIHFVSVDFVYHLENQISHRLIPEHLKWLRQDMAARAPGTFVVTGSENTLDTFNPTFGEIARKNDVRLQLVGDDHIVAYNDRLVPFRVGGALSGTWWNGPCADLSPRGYMLYSVRGEKMDCFYKGIGQRVAIASPRYGSALKGKVTFRAHLVQPGDGQSLEYSLNGSPWKPMREVARPFYRRVYETSGDSAAAGDGLITLKVRSVPDGEERSRVFVVHNDNDPAQVDTGAVLSFAVGNVWPSKQPPKAKVDVILNGQVVGRVEGGLCKSYALAIDAKKLLRINVLTFAFADTDDGMVITHPLLKIGDKTIEDPRGAAIRKVRAAHWGEAATAAMGFTVGKGPNEHSFAVAQDKFYFVLDPKD